MNQYKSPLAVIILTLVDALGFGPTIRKSYHNPYSESLLFFILLTIRNLIVIPALEKYSITTVLFPAFIAFICFLFIMMVIFRRGVV